MRFLPVLGILAAIVAAVLWSCVFIVTEKQQALLLAFGKFERKVTEPGLHFKYPQPLNTVVYFDDRILPLQTQGLQVIPKDSRRLVVVTFARYQISDPVKFYESVTTIESGERKLEQILITAVRDVLGNVNSGDILSEGRVQLMLGIRDQARSEAEEIGVTIVDVRIRSADLPKENLPKTYDRMRADRDKEAADERARGAEAAQIRRAEADREAQEINAEANREALIILGQADAERSRITAEAYGQNPEFFSFYRSLQAYEATLTKDTASFVITPGGQFSEFFEELGVSPAGTGQ